MFIKDIESLLLQNKLEVRYHNGIGMLQAYLTKNVRLHVWHPLLTTPLESFGNRHDHRFDMDSRILLGAIVDTQYQQLDGDGPFDVYTVKPAHFGESPIPQCVEQGIAFSIESIRKYTDCERYKCARGTFHETRAEGLTITLMKKSNQVDTWAHILATVDQRPEHAMARKPDQVIMNQLFFSALRKIPKYHDDYINAMTASDA